MLSGTSDSVNGSIISLPSPPVVERKVAPYRHTGADIPTLSPSMASSDQYHSDSNLGHNPNSHANMNPSIPMDSEIDIISTLKFMMNEMKILREEMSRGIVHRNIVPSPQVVDSNANEMNQGPSSSENSDMKASTPPSPTQLNVGNLVNHLNNNNYFVGNLSEDTTPPRRSTPPIPIPNGSSNRKSVHLSMSSSLGNPDKSSDPSAIPSSMSHGISSTSTGDPSVNPTHPLSFDKQKVPLEFSHSLPSKVPLTLGATESNDFIIWKGKIISSIEKIPKFTSMISANLAQSWAYFKSRNQSKYRIKELQDLYIDCHQEIFGFIVECLDEKFALQTKRVFEEGKYSICDELQFIDVNHPASHQNAHALMRYLEEYHVQTSHWRVAEIHSQLAEMKYTGQDDPRLFIRKFHDLMYSGQLLGNPHQWWPIYSDPCKATMLFSKLVGPSLQSARQRIQNLENIRPVTLKDVEEQIIQWWLDREANKPPAKHSNNKSQGQGQGQGQSNNQKKQRNPHNPAPEGHSANQANATPVPKGKQTKNSKKPSNPPPASASSEEGETQDETTGHEFGAAAIATPEEESQVEFAHASFKEIYSNNYIPQRNEILWDTGATVSMTPLTEKVKNVKQVPPVRISTMSGSILSKEVGTLRLGDRVRVDNIHILPKAPYSLFSLSKATANGGIVVFKEDGAFLLPPNLSRNKPIVDICERWSILYAKKKGNLWVSEMEGPLDKADEKVNFERMKQTTLDTTPARRVPKKEKPSKNITFRTVPSSSASPQEEKKVSPPSSSPSPAATRNSSLSAGLKSPVAPLRAPDFSAANSFAALYGADSADESDHFSNDSTSDGELSEEY